MNRPRFNGSRGFSNSNGRSNGSSFRNGNSSSSSSRFNNQKPRNRNVQADQFDLEKPVWNLAELTPIDKNVYREHPDAANRPNFVINQFLNTNNIVVTGDRFINPIFSFNETNYTDVIMQLLKSQNFAQPTIIQSMCWPILLSGYDGVFIAQTGSGKTLGFVLPLLMHILNHKRKAPSKKDDLVPSGPLGLIIAPTRELALQIQDVAETFGRPLGIYNMCIYGGAARGPQMHQMARGAEICIATPGRLLDFLKENLMQLCDCQFLILDEADRMLDMGFEPQITKIIEQTRPDRQTAMFSATWPKEVRKLAEDFLANYIHITIGMSELTANPNIKQIVEVCEEREKESRIKRILRDIMNSFDSKVIMFAETKRKVDNYSKFIRRLGYHCLTIHGDKKQSEREYVLNEFRSKPKSILVATDVAARGLNIEDIKYVVNIDFPNQTEDYIHRIGRTARSTNTGTAYTLVTTENAHKLPKLVDILRETNQEINRNVLDLLRMHQTGQLDNKNGNKRRTFNRYSNSSSNNNYNNHDYRSNNNNDRGDRYNSNSGDNNFSRKRPASNMMDSSSSNSHRGGGGDDDAAKRFRFNGNNNSDRSYNNNSHKSYSNGNSNNTQYQNQQSNQSLMSIGPFLSNIAMPPNVDNNNKRTYNLPPPPSPQQLMNKNFYQTQPSFSNNNNNTPSYNRPNYGQSNTPQQQNWKN